MPSRARKAYGDVGYDDGHTRIRLSLVAANNYMVGVGPTAVALEQIDRRTGVDYPGSIENSLAFLTVSGSAELSSTWSVQGDAYYRSFHQYLYNGAAASPYDGSTAKIDYASTTAPTTGAALQATSTDTVGGLGNQLLFGATYDVANSRFNSGSQAAAFSGTPYATQLGPDGSGQDPSVQLSATNSYAGVFIADTLDVAPDLALTLSGRFNHATVALTDLLGGGLAGTHNYDRLNPSVGAAYKLSPQATLFANYAEANRIPTPAELSCADPSQSCALASFFVADPDLNQVVAKSIEFGVRGQSVGPLGASLLWSASAYRTDISDDIIEEASPTPGHGFFQNDGNTRRQGLEASATLQKNKRWRLTADYSLVQATFQSSLAISSPNNPAADAGGKIYVRPGNAIPGIPEHRLKVGADYWVTPAWRVSLTAVYNGSQVLRGDESNQDAPLPGFVVVNARTEYSLTGSLEAFVLVDNLLNAQYDLYGTYSNLQGIPYPQAPAGIGATRMQTPAPPLGAFAGLRLAI